MIDRQLISAYLCSINKFLLALKVDFLNNDNYYNKNRTEEMVRYDVHKKFIHKINAVNIIY